MSKSKPEKKFKFGQVVRVTFTLSADAYGQIIGYDDGRWHVQIRQYEHKIVEAQLRALTPAECGK